MLNLGAGRYYAPPSVELFDDPVAAYAADLNSDGRQDIAVQTGGDLYFHAYGSLFALFGNGNATFNQVTVGSAIDWLGAPLAIADFNHDGRLDLAVTGFLGSGIYTAFNTGHNAFTTPKVFPTANTDTVMAAGDFNKDGYADAAFLNGNEVDIYTGKGDGTFTGPVTYKVGSNPTFILVHDLDGDGNRDLVITNQNSGDISVLYGNGNGTFQPARTLFAGAHPVTVTVADFNHDGKLDLAVGGDKVEVLLGRSNRTFASPVTYSGGGAATFITAVDLRGIGLTDLAITHGSHNSVSTQETISVLNGNRNGTFASPVSYYAGVNTGWLAVADFNGDGSTDLAAVDSGSTALTLLLNQGGTRMALKSSAGTVKIGTTVSFTATLAASVAAAGVPAGSITFKDGTRTLGVVPLTSGTAVFRTKSLAAGKHAITAVFLGNGAFNPHTSTAVTETVTR